MPSSINSGDSHFRRHAKLFDPAINVPFAIINPARKLWFEVNDPRAFLSARGWHHPAKKKNPPRPGTEKPPLDSVSDGSLRFTLAFDDPRD
jgi:hypothetical protein